jgi:ORF6N domain-containing protein
MSTLASTATIERHILLLRGQRVMLDSDLADLYGVSTKRLNEQVRRNIQRFPADFMFQLSPDEAVALRSQNATLEAGRGEAPDGNRQIILPAESVDRSIGLRVRKTWPIYPVHQPTEGAPQIRRS